MPHPQEYAVKDAIMMCDKGAAPGLFSPTINPNIKIMGQLVSTELDKLPLVHIPCFGVCSVKGAPCTPTPIQWQDTYKVKVKGAETLMFKSNLPCGSGGKIEFVTSGQTPLPPGGMEALMEEFGEEEKDEGGWGWWDTAELIPVVGNVIGMVREAKKGNWGMFALNAAFLIVDVVTLGAGAAATTPLKGGIKAGVKYAAKTAAKTAAKATTRAGAKSLAKGAAKSFAKAAARQVDDIAKAATKVCVFACFPAGTTVHSQSGDRLIENISVGDEVLSMDEKSYKIAPRKVIRTSSKSIGATVSIHVAEDIIETTAEHPFFTPTGWIEAADLSPGTQLWTADGYWHPIKSVDFQYEEKLVYNLEVEEYHTYFVGAWKWLVHNANVCVSNGVKRIKKVVVKAFKKNPKHNAAEFARQVADQQKGLNNLSVDDFIKNRDAYMRAGRSKAGTNAQKAYREAAKADKVAELRRAGKSKAEAEAAAEKYMKSRAALHDPDQIAGGFGHNVTRMGDKGVNSSLGSQWKSRAGDVDASIRNAAQGMTEAEKKSTLLNVELPIN